MVVDPSSLLPDLPRQSASPHAHAVLNGFERQGLPILQAIEGSPTLRPYTVEQAAKAGTLNDTSKHPGTSFVGAAASGCSPRTRSSSRAAASSRTGRSRRWARRCGPARHPARGEDRVLRAAGCLEDTIGPKTQGRVGSVNHGATTVVSVWEVTVARDFEYIMDRATKVAAWASAIGRANAGERGSTPRGRASGALFTGCALSVANHGLEFLPARSPTSSSG